MRSACVVCLFAMAITAGTACAQLTPFARLTAGTLNPGGPFEVTMAYGAEVGLRHGHHGVVAQVLVQSQNRNSGADLTRDARTFLLMGLERSGNTRGVPAREPFLRVSAGALLRSPYAVAPVVALAAGYRLQTLRPLWLVFTVSDAATYLRRDTSTCAVYPYVIYTCGIRGGVQHNFGGLLAAEFRL